MANETADEFFTTEHTDLLQMATVLTIFAWLALVIHVLLVLMQISVTYQWSQSTWPGYSLQEILAQYRVRLLGMLLRIAYIGFRGAVYWVVLRGAAMGLRMIAETNLNYGDMPEGGENE